jgi:hypothetical protein
VLFLRLSVGFAAIGVACSAGGGGTGFDGAGAGGSETGGGAGAGGSETGGGAGALPVPRTCGNGHVDPGERCDGADLAGATCASVTMNAQPAGVLSCTPSCTFSLLACSGGAGAGGAPGAGGMVGGGGLVGATGGAASSGGAPAAGGSGGALGGGPGPSSLPVHREPCPTFITGQMTFLNTPVMVWAGPPSAANGPVVFYFHGTTGSAGEVAWPGGGGLGQGALADVRANGGVVASFGTSQGCSANCGSGLGTNTGNGVWHTGDFDVADEILSCALEQLHVNPRRVHVAGYSAGGLQAGTMAFLRSNYIASLGIYSGGAFLKTPNPNPSNVPPVLGAHGAAAQDQLAQPTDAYATATKNAGSLAIVCDDGKAHYDPVRWAVAPNLWQFFKDHPYGTKPDPYAGGLPGAWPPANNCRLW